METMISEMHDDTSASDVSWPAFQFSVDEKMQKLEKKDDNQRKVV